MSPNPKTLQTVVSLTDGRTTAISLEEHLRPGRDDLPCADLTFLNLPNRTITDRDFSKTAFSSAELTGCQFNSAKFNSTCFDFATLDRSVFIGGVFNGVSARNASFRHCLFVGCNILDSEFQGSDFTNAVFLSSLTFDQSRRFHENETTVVPALGKSGITRTSMRDIKATDALFAPPFPTKTTFSCTDHTKYFLHPNPTKYTLALTVSFEPIELKTVDFSDADLTGASFASSKVDASVIREYISDERNTRFECMHSFAENVTARMGQWEWDPNEGMSTRIQRCIFHGANLANANLTDVDLRDSSLEDAALANAILVGLKYSEDTHISNNIAVPRSATKYRQGWFGWKPVAK